MGMGKNISTLRSLRLILTASMSVMIFLGGTALWWGWNAEKGLLNDTLPALNEGLFLIKAQSKLIDQRHRVTELAEASSLTGEVVLEYSNKAINAPYWRKKTNTTSASITTSPS